MADVEIGAGKTARRGYGLDEIAIVPSRRTRDASEVDISWRLDAYKFDLPFLTSPSDAVVSPTTASTIGELGGLGVLNLEGLWTRYEDPSALLLEIARLDPVTATPCLQQIYAEPVKETLVLERIEEIRASGAIVCGALRPQRAQELAATLLKAELDILVIQGTVVSAEHVTKSGEPLNLKTFIRELDIPIVVGGCSSYRTALHLMRTGAVGVLVGAGAAGTGTTRSVLGIGSPEATAIADAAGARTRHLEETGVYVQVVADAGMRRGGDLAKAIACGADAVMLGETLSRATDSAAPGATWGTSAWHATLPRGGVAPVEPAGTFEEILVGPGREGDGELNLFGALRASMAMCGCANIREFQRSDVVVVPPADSTGLASS